MEKISIVIPVYNTKKEYLDECIESVLSQSYENIEVIIIDDGSKSETANLCDGYAKCDSRIKVIHKKNEGVSVARNVGIQEACGEWVFFLDSDDWLEKDCFDNVEKHLDKDAIFFKRNVCENNQIKISDMNYVDDLIIDKYEKSGNLVKEILVNNDLSSTLGMCTGKLYKLEFLKSKNIKFPIGVPFREDSMFCILALQNVSKILLSTKAIYNYRINEEAVTQKKDMKCIENSDKLIKVCKQILKDEYLSDYYAFVIWQLNYICIKNIFAKGEKSKIQKLKEVLKKNNEYMIAVKKVDLKILSKRKKILVILLRIRCYFLLKYLYSWNIV